MNPLFLTWTWTSPCIELNPWQSKSHTTFPPILFVHYFFGLNLILFNFNLFAVQRFPNWPTQSQSLEAGPPNQLLMLRSNIHSNWSPSSNPPRLAWGTTPLSTYPSLNLITCFISFIDVPPDCALLTMLFALLCNTLAIPWHYNRYRYCLTLLSRYGLTLLNITMLSITPLILFRFVTLPPIQHGTVLRRSLPRLPPSQR